MIPVTVVIPVYNGETFLKETIESVLDQTFTNFELILVDDGSTDSSLEIIHSFTDRRIRFIQCPHDFIGTVNRGYQLAKGKYIAQLDHDDWMIPERLQIQYDFMESNPQITGCGGWMRCFGKHTHVIQMPPVHEEIMLSMLRHGPILNPTGFVRKQFLIEHQIKHQTDYSYYADVKFWFEVAKKGRLANIPQVLTLYRTSDKQATEKLLPKCPEILAKIKMEVLEYLLLQLTNEEKLVDKVKQQFIPELMKLKEQDFFTDDIFFGFMYEVLSGLLCRD